MPDIGEPHNSLNSHLPRFPELDDTALHGLAGEIVRTILPHSEADAAALLVQTLVFFGNCIGRTTHFFAEDDKHHANLFAVLVGASSKSRKGTSLGRVRRIFQRVDEKWEKTRIVNGLSSGEGLIMAVQTVDDGALSKRLLVIESEFVSVLRTMAREGNTLSAIIRAAWDTGALNVLTKNNPLGVTDAHISIIGHITREELRRRLTETDRANGFANRILWVATRRSKLLPEGSKLDDATCNRLAEQLCKALKHAQSIGEMQRNEEARALWFEIYERLSTEHDGLLGAVTSRAEAQVMRLACLYALLDCSAEIRRVHLEAAHALWQYCEASAGYVFGQLTGNQIADCVLKALEQVGSAGLTQTQISNLFSGHKSSEEINTALLALLNQELVTSQTESTGGRPTVRWFAVGVAKKAEKAEEPS